MATPTTSRKLKANCLGFTELLAQNVALISPTMTAALIVPVMYSNTGDWSWLSYALGTVMLLFVAFNLNQFTKRSTSAGSMYAYICRGLGLTAGAIGGWALIWAYLGIAIAGVTGFTVFAGKLLSMMGINAPPILLFAVCVAVSWYLRLEERQSVGPRHADLRGHVDGAHHRSWHSSSWAIMDLRSTRRSSIPRPFLGRASALASWSRFSRWSDSRRRPPSATKPKIRSRPCRASIYVSLIISGVFFVFVTYVEVLGTRGYSTTLDKIDQPLNILAQLIKMPLLQIPLSAGAMLSFFALNLSCVSAGGRIIYALGRHGILPPATASAHDTNETPHIAVTIMALVSFIVPTVAMLGHQALLDIFNDAGTCAAFGFVTAYALITVAAPVYLKKIGELKPIDIAGCAASLLLLAVPAVGSVYPVPSPPVSYFPYVFLAYLAIGAVWIIAFYRRTPDGTRHDQGRPRAEPRALPGYGRDRRRISFGLVSSPRRRGEGTSPRASSSRSG